MQPAAIDNPNAAMFFFMRRRLPARSKWMHWAGTKGPHSRSSRTRFARTAWRVVARCWQHAAMREMAIRWRKIPPSERDLAEKREARAKLRKVGKSKLRSLRKDFSLVMQQCIDLLDLHALHNELFGTEEASKILRSTAHEFFDRLSGILQAQWIIEAFKLGDKASHGRRLGRKENMSVPNLDRSLRMAKLRTKEIVHASKGIRRYWRIVRLPRNKIVAHASRRHYRSGRGIGGHSEHEVRGFLQAMQDYCSAVGKAIGRWPGELRSGAQDDAWKLLKHLRFATRS